MLLCLLSTLGAAAPPLRVLGLQIEATPGETQKNLRRAEALIRQHPGHNLYVLPELSSQAYDDAVLAELDAHAEDATHGATARFFQRVAREADAHICFGLLRRTAEGGVTICQAVAGPAGTTVATYDKMHLCDMGDCSEVGYGLTPGTDPCVFECKGVRVGLSVCYDIRFPELYRALAWDHNCDLILHPSAFVRDATFECYHQFATCRAVENGVYLLSVNFAGERFGDSIAVPPWIGPVPGIARGEEEGDELLAAASLGTEEGVLPLIVDAGHLAAVRAAYPYRRNVHPALRSDSR